MTRLFSLLFLLFSLVTFAQEDEEVHSIFFEFDKYNLKVKVKKSNLYYFFLLSQF